MVIKVAIIDRDKEYVHRLYMALNEFEELNLSVFTEEENFEKTFASTDYHVILFTPQIFDKKFKINKLIMPILLVDDFTKIPDSLNDINKIKKYQRASQIYRELLDIYSLKCKSVGEIWNKDKMNIFSVFSPAGGIGKTTISVVLAEKIAKLGYRTLYLNFEDFPSQNVYFKKEKGKSIADLFTTNEEKPNILLKVKSLIHQNNKGVYYFNHFESPNDLYDLTEGEIEELLTQLSQTGLFDVVIIDMNSSIIKQNIKIFELSKKIVLVDRADSLIELKMQHFVSQTHIMNSSESKMLRILNFYSGKESKFITSIPVIGRVKAIQNTETVELIRSLSDSDAVQFHESLLI